MTKKELRSGRDSTLYYASYFLQGWVFSQSDVWHREGPATQADTGDQLGW